MEYIKLLNASTLDVYAVVRKAGHVITRYTPEEPDGYSHEPSLRFFYGSFEDSDLGNTNADPITKREFDEIRESWTS
jgi:hypothetical protein